MKKSLNSNKIVDIEESEFQIDDDNCAVNYSNRTRRHTGGVFLEEEY